MTAETEPQRDFIGRFDHYCGRVRAIYSLRDGGMSQTDWFDTETRARADVPDEAVQYAARVAEIRA